MSTPTRPTPRRRRWLYAVVLAVIVSPLSVLAAPAQAVPSTGLIITEVYPGGGNASATYNADFVELYNVSDSPISLNGKSLQYRAATNTGVAGNVYVLPNVSVPAHSYYLIGGSTGSNGVASPRSPDVVTGLAAGASAGQIFLADTTSGINPVTGGACVFAGGTIDYSAGKVIDFFGYGTQSTSVCGTNTGTYEGASKTGAITTAQSYQRIGLVDHDNNNTDYTIAAVNGTSGSGTGVGPDNCDCVAPTGLKITEVYTEGGKAGAAFDHDYVELQNTSGATLSMTGLSLQYRAPGATGTATKVLNLSGSMANNTYDIIQLGTDGTDGAAVPFDAGYDASATGPNLDSAGGTLFVVKSTDAYNPGTGAVTTDQYRSDLIGWGSSNTYETAAADSSTMTVTKSLTRLAGGTDTNDNSADFNVLATTPNAAPEIPHVTIAEIQGTGATTPMPNALVTTEGVVTAVYPSGTNNFAGFYMQTGGADTTPNASDAVFVYMGNKTSPAVGATVSVTGRVSEFFGMTELTPSTAGDVVPAGVAQDPVVPGERLPGTDCTVAAADCLTGSALAAEREKHEGELFKPTDPFTVTDGYDGSPWANSGSANYGEIGVAANSTKPLYLSYDLANPKNNLATFNANEAFNEAHAITLSDGLSGTVSASTAYPWMTKDYTVRVGAAVTFPQGVIFDYRNDAWKLQPLTPIAGGSTGESQVAIEQNRPAAPADVLGATGNVKIATFNMLNYFVHDAESWAALADDASGSGRKCTYYNERSGAGSAPTYPGRVTANTCSWTDTRGVVAPATPVVDGGLGPRGAAQKCDCGDLTDPKADFERQQAKEILAINKMDADVMSLEEVENPIKLGYGGVNPTAADRDMAVAHLVDVLNQAWADAHPAEDVVANPRWAFVPSPRPEAQPTIAEQDAIRSAFIYNPRKIETVGRSEILVNSAPFRNAREPLAQAFKHVDGSRDDGFVVIVNHLKSKSAPLDPTTVVGTDNDDAGKGAGYYNGDRVRQVKALDAFAKAVADDKGIPAVFMTGDYNAYGQEDPVLALEDAGWTNLEPENGEASYSFAGLAGSLDHVFANAAAVHMVSGQTIWPINANEPVYYEYSRYNYNLTQFYDGTVPFRASDHNPEIIGVNAPVTGAPAAVDTVQLLASNDFHGRILDDPGSAAAGAAAMAGAVEGLRDDNENTIFAMAGDIIGASTFESFIQNDKPTLDALNEAGLDVSSAGNHEFDKGYDDLRNRVMSDDGADWPYLAANLRLKSDNSYALAPENTARDYDDSNGASWWKQLPDGKRIGFIGAVTEDLPSLVAPDAIAALKINSIVDEVNTEATRLKDDGCGGQACDLVIELVHEGNATPDCSTVDNPATTFGKIVTGANDDIDAIVSGHTHLKYNCKVAVPGWSGRDVTKRPVVSAGQYGSYLNQLEFDFDPGTGDLLDIRQHVLAMKDYDEDAATKAVVDSAVAYADTAGQATLGSQTAPFQRARRNDPTTSTVVENRGGESTLGNLVAEIQRETTGADIGFMNPGGLRADLMGKTPGSYPSDITKRQAADVQPFANTLMTVELTGAQIKRVLEEQWQRDPDGNIPSRPFLRLGTSTGFTYTYDPTRPDTWTGDANPGDRITGMWLDGEPIDLTATYTVSASNFMMEGGDNFRVLTEGVNRTDTAKTDLQGTVDYLGDHDPVSPDFGQHAVGVHVTTTVPPSGFGAGQSVTLDVTSLAMTGDQVQSDTQDSDVTVYDGAGEHATALGTAAAVSNALRSLPDDEAGKATVTFTIPAGVESGDTTFWLKGDASGTVVPFTVPTRDDRTATTVSADDVSVVYGDASALEITVDPDEATGTVTVKEGTTTLGTAELTDGEASYALAARSLEAGEHTLTLRYGGDSTHAPSTATVTVTVSKAPSTVSALASPATVVQGSGTSDITVTVSSAGSTPTGTVSCDDGTPTSATLTAGEATCSVGPFASTGAQTVTVTYAGDANTQAGSTTVAINVTSSGGPVEPTPADTTVSGQADSIMWGNPGTVHVKVTSSQVTTGTVTVREGSTALGSASVAGNGTADVVIPAKALAVGNHTLTVSYAGDANNKPSSGTVTVLVFEDESPASVTSTTTVTVDPAKVAVHRSVTATAEVTTPDGVPTGEVTFSVDGTAVATVSLDDDGMASAEIGPFGTVGTHHVTARYNGNEGTTASEAGADVRTVKATPRMKVNRDPKRVVRKKTKLVVEVQLQAPGQVVTGKVKITGGPGGAHAAKLTDGSVEIKLPVFKKARKVTLKVTYLGSADNQKVTKKVTFKVHKKR